MRSRWRSSASTWSDQKRRKGASQASSFHERLGPDPIDAPLRVHARFHEAGLAEHAEVLGDRGLRHPKRRSISPTDRSEDGEQAQDGPAVRFRDDAEGRFHGNIYLTSHMPVKPFDPRPRAASRPSYRPN